MVQFNTKYLNQFDARYYPSEIGTTVAPQQQAQRGLDAQLRTGAKLVEINVGDVGPATVGLSGGGPIPVGGYGKEERQEIKELAQVNKATVTTHAGSSTTMSPLGQRGPDKEQRERNMEELRADVDFAHDIGAESVTVHVIGTPRPLQRISEREGGKIQIMGQEEHHFVDMKTGKLVGNIGGSDEMQMPQLKRNPKGGWDFVYDKDTHGIKYYNSQDFGLQQGESITFDTAARYFEKNKQQVLRNSNLSPDQIDRVTGEELAIAHYFTQNEIVQRSQWQKAQNHSKMSREVLDLLGNPEDKKSLIYNLYNPDEYSKLSRKEREKLDEDLKKASKGYGEFSFVVPGLDPTDSESWNEVRPMIQRRYEELTDVQQSQMLQAGGAKQKLTETEQLLSPYNDDVLGRKYYSRIQPLTHLAEKENIEGVADLAYHSYQRSKQTKQKVTITPENIFPKFYGSHPDELRDVVINSRKLFEKQLREKEKINPKDAEKLSKEFIGACFDVGHANMWKRYWKGDKDKFDDWLVGETEKLAKEGIIKKIHVNDNFGYEDDSLPPGQGNVPIKRVVDKIREHTGKIPIISEGFGVSRDQSWRQITEAWELFNPHVYNQAHVSNTGIKRTWDKLHYFDSNFRSYNPGFLAGPAAVEEDLTTWEDLPLE